MGKLNQKPSVFGKLKPTDWTDDCDSAFITLKEKLLNCAELIHADFSKPLIPVLSQIAEGETKACLIAFASKTLTGS